MYFYEGIGAQHNNNNKKKEQILLYEYANRLTFIETAINKCIILSLNNTSLTASPLFSTSFHP